MSSHVPARIATRVPWAGLSGVRVGVVLWGGLAVLDLGRLVTAPAYVDLGAVALLVVAASVGMRTPTVVTAALVGWLVVNGFVVHRYGALGFDGPADAARLALLVGLALAAGRAHR